LEEERASGIFSHKAALWSYEQKFLKAPLMERNKEQPKVPLISLLHQNVPGQVVARGICGPLSEPACD